MTGHRHRVKSTRTVGSGPVVCHVDTCACGATRRTNSTGGGRGPWARPSEGRPESERGAVVVSLRLPREALARLDARATAAGMSRSAFVASIA